MAVNEIKMSTSDSFVIYLMNSEISLMIASSGKKLDFSLLNRQKINRKQKEFHVSE